jgi:hypothetical protein
MRTLSFLFLIGFVAVVGIFAYLNNRPITIDLFGQVRETSLPVLAGAVYLLGMFTGWAVIGMLKRSWSRVVEYDRR